VTSPSGKGETIRLNSEGDEWGVFTGKVLMTEPGKHEAVLYCKETNAQLETSLFVQGGTMERMGLPARPEVLEEIARMTRGEVFSPHQPDQIIKLLGELPEPPPSVRRLPLWSHPGVAGLVIMLLGVFWVGRKVVGLI
jgi:hypothetical protein